MPKTDTWMGKLILIMLTIIIALIGVVFTFQQSGMAENKLAITALEIKVAAVNELLIGAGYEKRMLQKDVLSIGKRLKRLEGARP